jgi:hypothetical protein
MTGAAAQKLQSLRRRVDFFAEPQQQLACLDLRASSKTILPGE